MMLRLNACAAILLLAFAPAAALRRLQQDVDPSISTPVASIEAFLAALDAGAAHVVITRSLNFTEASVPADTSSGVSVLRTTQSIRVRSAALFAVLTCRHSVASPPDRPEPRAEQSRTAG